MSAPRIVWRVNSFAREPLPLEVVKETEHFLTTRDPRPFADGQLRKEKKSSAWASYFASYGEARDALIARAQRGLDAARANVQAKERELAEVMALPEQPPGGH